MMMQSCLRQAFAIALERTRTYGCAIEYPGTDTPLKLTLTRCNYRWTDTGNLPYALKSVQDGIADALNINDDGRKHEWLWRQGPYPKGKEKGVMVEISWEIA
jgi:hypothetical protein